MLFRSKELGVHSTNDIDVPAPINLNLRKIQKEELKLPLLSDSRKSS